MMTENTFLGGADENILTILPSLQWFLLILFLVIAFRNELHGLLENISWRVKLGAPIKIAYFELGASYISPTGDSKSGFLDARVSPDDKRYEERKNYYEPNRGIFLVHKLAPSKHPKQLYDIILYLIPHKDATLASVQKVEYYFGKHWDNRIFTSIDRASGFKVSTSAYGPFVCTAMIYFTDGKDAIIWRYVDFEAGALGSGIRNNAQEPET
jgi:hypothetical protein